jgi:FkbM family methyltransferase
MNKKQFFTLLITFFTYTTSLVAIGEAVPWALLRRMLPTNPIILEAGAQFGEDTAWMSQFWPQSTIYAFEPSPESFPSLKEVALNNSNVIATQCALSNLKGEFLFYLAGGASSLLKPTDSFNNDYFHSDLNNPITVPVTTLDEWAFENNIPYIDFMWLDMEGNELNALQGALNILKNVKLIYTEVNLQRFWENCVMYDELTAWMNDHGFTEIWSDIVPHWHGNVLFMNTNN